jgi:hypothetical protein
VVTDASGASVETSSASAVIAGSFFLARRKDATTLRFDALPAGAASISVMAPGWAKREIRDVQIAASSPPPPLTVVLDPGIAVHGTIRVDSGTLPDETSVVIRPVEQGAPDSVGMGVVFKTGTFTMTGLAPGRYRVTVFDSARRDGSVRFVVAGDGTLTVPDGGRDVEADLVLVRAGTLAMSARDARLPPAPFAGGVSDPAKDKFGADSRIDVVDSSGVVVASQTPVYAGFAPSVALAPGEYVVRLHLSGEAPQERRCTVKAGEMSSASFPAK